MLDVMRIALTLGRESLVDGADYLRVASIKWHASYDGRGMCYGRGLVLGKKMRMHRFIINAPRGMQVDHINGNTLDNRRSNLRLCDQSENNANRPKALLNCHSKFKGVTPVNRTSRFWTSRIKKNGRRVLLGRFESEIEAAKAYDTAAKQFFGPFARLNFPDQNQTLPSASLSYADRSSECRTDYSAIQTMELPA